MKIKEMSLFIFFAFVTIRSGLSFAATDLIPMKLSLLECELNNELLFRRENLIFQSPVMNEVASKVRVYAEIGVKQVFITGETGTGKGAIARLLHKLGSRSTKPFIEYVAQQVPDELVQSKLFGHKKGSFTGAVADAKGAIERAEGGTLFIDEIQNFSQRSRQMLLQFLQTGEYQVVGDNLNRKADVTVIIATNQDLKLLVEKNQFPSDLFFRITNGGRIDLPPLRNRKGDINPLVNYFIEKFNKQYGAHFRGADPNFISTLKDYDWPGNVRELEGFITQAMLEAYIHDKDADILISNHFPSAPINPTKVEAPIEDDGDLPVLEYFILRQEAALIAKALFKSRYTVGGKRGAAALLAVGRTSLIAKIRKLQRMGYLTPGDEPTLTKENSSAPR